MLSYLKARQWAGALSAGNGGGGYESCSNYCTFQVTVTLMEEGLAFKKEVVGAILQYLTMLRKGGVQERIFTELQAIAHNSFQFEVGCQ